jgi:tRNA(adenine34) deaminase
VVIKPALGAIVPGALAAKKGRPVNTGTFPPLLRLFLCYSAARMSERQSSSSIALECCLSNFEDEFWMRKAIAIAVSQGSEPATSPIGAVIVVGHKLIAIERNQCAKLNDATAHAEMMAIRKAGAKIGSAELRGGTLFTTLQPCGMCTMASIWSKVGRVVFGAGREDVHSMYFEARHIDTISFIGEAYRDDIEISGGCLRAECSALYFGPKDDVPIQEQGNL